MRYFAAQTLDTQLGSYVTELMAASLRLFKSGTTIVPNMQLADLIAIEADFTGYSANDLSAYTPIGPYPTGVGDETVLIQTTGFACNGTPPVTPNTIAGYFIAKTASPHTLYEYGTFDAPVIMQNPFQVLVINLQMTLPCQVD